MAAYCEIPAHSTSVVVHIVLCLGVYFFFVLLVPYVCYHILVKFR